MKLFYGIIDSHDNIQIDSEEQWHIIKVLRMKDGEEIFLTDGKGNLAKGNLILEGKKAEFLLRELQTAIPESDSKLHIVITPTKNIDRTEFFVEKATELGVSEISFVVTEKSERKNLNIDKIRRQVIAASKQSLRFHFPKVNMLSVLTDFLNTFSNGDVFVAHCHKSLEKVPLKTICPKKEITFLIGPEGDFSEREIILLAEKNITAVSLGNQRLRTETAGVFVAAWHYSFL